MALKIKVKAGRINNLSDARYCAGMGVEMLGFPVDQNSNESVSPELFDAITGWVSGIDFIGESASNILPDTGLYDVSGLQVKYPELLPEIKAKHLKSILVIDLAEISYQEAEDRMSEYSTDVDFFLIENGGAAELSEDNMRSIKEWASRYSVMLGYGIQQDNIDKILSTDIEAIAIYGSDEERPGFKNYDEMADILEALEED